MNHDLMRVLFERAQDGATHPGMNPQATGPNVNEKNRRRRAKRRKAK